MRNDVDMKLIEEVFEEFSREKGMLLRLIESCAKLRRSLLDDLKHLVGDMRIIVGGRDISTAYPGDIKSFVIQRLQRARVRPDAPPEEKKARLKRSILRSVTNRAHLDILSVITLSVLRSFRPEVIYAYSPASGFHPSRILEFKLSLKKLAPAMAIEREEDRITLGVVKGPPSIILKRGLVEDLRESDLAIAISLASEMEEDYIRIISNRLGNLREMVNPRNLYLAYCCRLPEHEELLECTRCCVYERVEVLPELVERILREVGLVR